MKSACIRLRPKWGSMKKPCYDFHCFSNFTQELEDVGAVCGRNEGVNPGRLTQGCRAHRPVFCFSLGECVRLPATVQTVFARARFRFAQTSIRLFRCRSEEHTSELQSRQSLVCRLL